MAINNGYTDTAISGVSALAFPRGLVNLNADYRVSSATASEIKITNLTSPLDRPEIFRIAYSVIPDVYKNSGISSGVKALTSKGVSILVQLTNVYREDSIPTMPVDLPVSAHLVIRVPAHASVSAALVEAHVGRLLSGLFDTGSLATNRIGSLLRGSLQPAGL